MHRIATTIRRTIRAALHTGSSLVSAACRRQFLLIADLYRAIDAGAVVVIGYRKSDGEESVRAVRPQTLTPTEAGHIVLRAYDHRDAEDTTFRIDRIVNYRLTKESVMSRPVNLDRPTDTLKYERDLIANVVEDGAVRPEMAAAMSVRADRIDGEVAVRADEIEAAPALVVDRVTGEPLPVLDYDDGYGEHYARYTA